MHIILFVCVKTIRDEASAVKVGCGDPRGSLLAGQAGIPNKTRNSAFLLHFNALKHTLDVKKFNYSHF